MSTAGDTVNKSGLRKIKRELASLRGTSRKTSELESIARRLDRGPRKGGRHGQIWESLSFDGLTDFAIPHHTKDCGPGVVNYIVRILEGEDIPAWEAHLKGQEKEEGDQDEYPTGTDPEGLLD